MPFRVKNNRLVTVSASAKKNDLVDFIDTVNNLRLRDRLERAIHGKGAFRRFKDVLYDNPEERERWFKFQDDRMHRRVLDWLESEGIEPV